jgi:hypothetical protein
MTRETKLNLIYSTIIVTTVTVFATLISLNSKESNWAFFFSFLIGGLYSIITGTIMLIIVFKSKKYWNSIPFITSGLVNFIMLYIPIMWLTDGANGVNPFLIIMFTFPVLILIAQILLFINLNRLTMDKPN